MRCYYDELSGLVEDSKKKNGLYNQSISEFLVLMQKYYGIDPTFAELVDKQLSLYCVGGPTYPLDFFAVCNDSKHLIRNRMLTWAIDHPHQVFDVVTPYGKQFRQHPYVLHSGCSMYDRAVVAQIEPYVLISEEGDMMWTDIVPSDFELHCKASKATMYNVIKRFNEEFPDRKIIL